METALIVLGALIIGWFLGYYPNRKDNLENHYQDMKLMVNQFADLSAKMFNATNTGTNPVMMPMPQEFEDMSEEEEVEKDEALSGGRM